MLRNFLRRIQHYFSAIKLILKIVYWVLLKHDKEESVPSIKSLELELEYPDLNSDKFKDCLSDYGFKEISRIKISNSHTVVHTQIIADDRFNKLLIFENRILKFYYPLEATKRISIQHSPYLLGGQLLVASEQNVTSDPQAKIFFLNIVGHEISQKYLKMNDIESRIDVDMDDSGIIGLDVDSEGRYLLIGLQFYEWPKVLVYDFKQQDFIIFDCVELIDARISNVTWGSSIKKITFFNDVIEKKQEITINWHKRIILWDVTP